MSRGGWGERAVYVGDIEGTAQLQAEAGGTTVQCARHKLRLRGTLGPMAAAGPREAAVQGHHSVQGHTTQCRGTTQCRDTTQCRGTTQ